MQHLYHIYMHKLYKMGTSEENSDIVSLLLYVKNNNISHDDYPY